MDIIETITRCQIDDANDLGLIHARSPTGEAGGLAIRMTAVPDLIRACCELLAAPRPSKPQGFHALLVEEAEIQEAPDGGIYTRLYLPEGSAVTVHFERSTARQVCHDLQLLLSLN